MVYHNSLLQRKFFIRDQILIVRLFSKMEQAIVVNQNCLLHFIFREQGYMIFLVANDLLI